VRSQGFQVFLNVLALSAKAETLSDLDTSATRKSVERTSGEGKSLIVRGVLPLTAGTQAPRFHIYGINEIIRSMKEESVRTTIDIPVSLYRRLKEQAAARGHSVRQLVLAGIKGVLREKRARRKRVRFPLITSEGPKVEVTNQPIYEPSEFPGCQRLARTAMELTRSA